MIIRQIETAERRAFNDLVAHVTQAWEWGDFRLKTAGLVSLARVGAFTEKSLANAWQIFFHKTPFGKQTIAYLPRGNKLTPEVFPAIKKICRENAAIFLKIEPEENPDSGLGFIPGEAILPKHNLIVSLGPSIEEILAAMHEKTRYNIRLAQKGNVVVSEKTDSELLEKFIALYDATQKRQDFYGKGGDYLRLLWETLAPARMAHLLCAYVPEEKDPIAAAVLLLFKDTLYFPYGGWSAKYRERMPNNLLHFEAIKLGKKLGATKYDFWSSYKNTPDQDDPWYGTYIFKKGFGGTEVHYPGAFDYVFNKPLYQLLKIGNAFRWQYLHFKRKFPF